MTFVQAEFVAFFAIVFTVYWVVRRRRAQNALLVLASAVFYGWIHPWFLLLLFGSATLDFAMGQAIRRAPAHRRWFLAASLAGNLGLLGTFKYLDFFIDNVAAAMGGLGVQTSLHSLGILLPVAISFYTFQTMSYTIDVYRGRVEARSSYLDYLVYVSFFPQLVAGPVERASHLLPQVERRRVFSVDAMRAGLSLVLWGAFKKIVIADTLAPHVDTVFVTVDPTAPALWAGTLGFTLQILADFSGYTDIARGTARMLGFELVENFRHPYLATHPADFWRRWHVSFSTWIRDYLYIPLGGSRHGFVRTVAATVVAMLLAGLWHGASWNFVLWGAYHAALLVAYRLAMPLVPDLLRRLPGARLAAMALMFAFTCVGWVIFREVHLERLWSYPALLPFGVERPQWILAIAVASVALVFGAPLAAGSWVEQRLWPRLSPGPWSLPLQTTFWTACALAILTFARTDPYDFVYFQF